MIGAVSSEQPRRMRAGVSCVSVVKPTRTCMLCAVRLERFAVERNALTALESLWDFLRSTFTTGEKSWKVSFLNEGRVEGLSPK